MGSDAVGARHAWGLCLLRCSRVVKMLHSVTTLDAPVAIVSLPWQDGQTIYAWRLAEVKRAGLPLSLPSAELLGHQRRPL